MLLYKLTPWSRVLSEKLTDPQLVKKFLAFYGTRRFITPFTKARHFSSLNPRFVSPFRNMVKQLAQPPSWTTTPCRLSTVVYLINSQLPSMSDGRFSIRYLKKLQAVATETHLSRCCFLRGRKLLNSLELAILYKILKAQDPIKIQD